MTRFGSDVRRSWFSKNEQGGSGRFVALLVSVALLSAGLVGVFDLTSASAGGGPFTLTTVTTNPLHPLNPIGITYDESSNDLVISDSPSTGVEFQSVGSSGNLSRYSNVNTGTSGNEVYLVAIRTPPPGSPAGCLQSFVPGEVFYGTGTAGQIGRLSSNGTQLTPPWQLPVGETGTVQGLYQDYNCNLPSPFTGDLVVTTATDSTNGLNAHVYVVNSNGAAANICKLNCGDHLEGPTTVPPNPTRYGPWAGTILAADETCGCVDSFNTTTGIATPYSGFGTSGQYGAEGVYVVPPNENFYGADYGGSGGATLQTIPATQFAGNNQTGDNVVGDVVVTTEGDGELLDAKWNGSVFTAEDLLSTDAAVDTTLGTGVAWEGATFAPVAVGPAGTLKICKVAGIGVAVGTPVKFNVSPPPPSVVTVPAGPAPGGWCELAGSNYAVGSSVTLTEQVPGGDQIVGVPTSNVPLTNLGGGKVSVKIGTGVTEVTYTDQHRPIKGTGYLEICKVAFPSGSPPTPLFTFNVAGGPSVAIPAGACSPPLNVIAGPAVKVTETAVPGFPMTACTTAPLSAYVSCAPPTATVKVAAGGISSETILTVTDTTAQTGFLEICKTLINPGTTPTVFNFTVNGQTVPVTSGACSSPINLPAGNYVVTEQPQPFKPMQTCGATPTSALVPGSCNLATEQATVIVSPGNSSSATVLTITDLGIRG
jgi:hypothetical protein